MSDTSHLIQTRSQSLYKGLQGPILSDSSSTTSQISSIVFVEQTNE